MGLGDDDYLAREARARKAIDKQLLAAGWTVQSQNVTRADLADFVTCYNPDNRHERKETERFHAFTYSELTARDKASLDIFWLRDESLADSENLPAPEVIAAEIVEDLQAALDQFAAIATSLATRGQDPSA